MAMHFMNAWSVVKPVKMTRQIVRHNDGAKCPKRVIQRHDGLINDVTSTRGHVINDVNSM